MSYLQRFPLLMHEEVLNIGMLHRRGQLTAMLRDPREYLRSVLWRRLPGFVPAVGCKLFYDQATERQLRQCSGETVSPELRVAVARAVEDAGGEAEVLRRFADMWNWLRDLPDLAVIHLVRRNMLAVGVSYVEALRSGQWHFRAGHAPSSRPPLEPIHLTPDQCRSYFQMLQADRDRTEAFFAHRPMLRVDFEDLTIDPSAELTRIQAFLGVRFPLRAPAFKKQATRPLRDRIANYAELEAAFADTPWAVFFQTSEFPPDSSAYSRT